MGRVDIQLGRGNMGREWIGIVMGKWYRLCWGVEILYPLKPVRHGSGV